MTTSPPARPRVLHLGHTCAVGGAELALTRMLAAHPGWNPVVMVPPGEQFGVFSDIAVPVRTGGVRQPTGAASSGALGVVPLAARVLAQAAATRTDRAFRTADVIDANTTRAAVYGALAARSTRTPFVVHLRDMVASEALGRVGAAAMTRLVLPRADAVVADTQATVDTATPFVRPGTVREVIPSASGLVPVPPGTSRAAQPRTGEPLRIGMLARIDPWKGQHLLLDAFAAVLSESDAIVEFAGSPFFGHDDYAAQLRARARARGVADRVRFLGQVDDVAALLAGWDIAVQYSTRPEPLGQNVLQYLAAGCAVIVADEGGPPEWVRDGVNGLAVPPRNHAALAGALRQLLTEPEFRRALATRAPATAGLLNDAQVAARHAHLYRRIVRDR